VLGFVTLQAEELAVRGVCRQSGIGSDWFLVVNFGTSIATILAATSCPNPYIAFKSLIFFSGIQSHSKGRIARKKLLSADFLVMPLP